MLPFCFFFVSLERVNHQKKHPPRSIDQGRVLRVQKKHPPRSIDQGRVLRVTTLIRYHLTAGSLSGLLLKELPCTDNVCNSVTN